MPARSPRKVKNTYNPERFKPGQLVRWYDRDNTTGHYWVEVMSMRTPEGTYMVRKVPGQPGTLAEVSQRNLNTGAGLPQPRMVHLYEVAGSGHFPSDMLRYDGAQPFNFTLDENDRPHLEPGMPEGTPLVVAVAGPARGAAGGVTPERWSSFCWGIRYLRSFPIAEGA